MSLEEIKKLIIPILKRYGVKKAGLFGSFVMGKAGKDSDVDILVEIGDNKMSLLGFVEIKLAIEEVLGKKVDLVEYTAIKPLLKEKILSEEVSIL